MSLNRLLLPIAIVALPQLAFPQDETRVTIPPYEDAYGKMVRQLESGQTDIDYRKFRESFLESEQFKAAAKQKSELGALRKTMRELMGKSQYDELVTVAKKILGIDYTDMEAHKILQQTYKILGDSTNQKKYHDIEFGLLRSIVNNGDGKSCETAWPVIQIEEEYFVLRMLGAKLLKQSVANQGGLCDRMEVETEKGKEVFYFEVTKVFQGYKK